jgi:predicted RNA-binding protein with PIN domain
MAERSKDPHDFFAYPALFFREVEKTPRKMKKRQKKQMKKTKSVAHLSQETPKISLEKIRQFLPLLSNF